MAGKARVHELAKELGVTSKEVLARLSEQGEFVKSASSTVEAPVARRLRESFGGAKPAAEKVKPQATARRQGGRRAAAKAGPQPERQSPRGAQARAAPAPAAPGTGRTCPRHPPRRRQPPAPPGSRRRPPRPAPVRDAPPRPAPGPARSPARRAQARRAHPARRQQPVLLAAAR